MLLQLPSLPNFIDLLADKEANRDSSNNTTESINLVRSLAESLILRFINLLGQIHLELQKQNDDSKNGISTAMRDLMEALGADSQQQLDEQFISRRSEQMLQKMCQWGSKHRSINLVKSMALKFAS